jgi:ADP-ribose pyrophosphatase YjhB (NUDIX family)
MIQELIDLLEEKIKNPSKGLQDELFYFIGRLTPFINVDLLVKNNNNQTLLSWRNETINNKVKAGWHIPGGIIRFRETIAERLNQVALSEMGGKLAFFSKDPIAINQIIDHDARDRSHFISLLYACQLEENYKINNHTLNNNDEGFLKWHSTVPDDLLDNHIIYRDYI